MISKNSLYHSFSMFWHAVSAWNTGGEGIHSPRLFYLVRHLFYESSELYAWNAIEERRQAMLRAPKLIHIKDFGTGKDRDELVMHIARHSVMDRQSAQLLARLLHYMSGSEYVPQRTSPLTIVELGTSLGITTAYLATADSRNQVVTFEGSDEIAAMAQLNWQKLKISNITQLLGPIDDTLYKYVRASRAKIDFALLDANHTGEATLRYFEWILPHMDSDGVMVVDDIRYSRDMYEAWKKITTSEKVTATMDMGRFGLVFFYPSVQQRTYKLRV